MIYLLSIKPGYVSGLIILGVALLSSLIIFLKYKRRHRDEEEDQDV